MRGAAGAMGMKLSTEDVLDFYRVQHALLSYVNRKAKLFRAKLDSAQAFAKLHPEDRLELHDALRERPELIDAFVAANPARLDEADLATARSWVGMVSGEFYIYRQLDDYMVFLSASRPTVAYGVVALVDSIGNLDRGELPRLYETSLLPFRGRIVYDGILVGEDAEITPTTVRRLDREFKAIEARSGIITSLADDAAPPPATPPGKRPAPKKRAKAKPPADAGPARVPEAARPAYEAIVALTDAFCRDRLDDEYAALCRKMAGVLARKRPSPLVRGKPASWAAGIVRALGFVNFLGDPSQPHPMKMTDVDAGFGVSEATGSAKSKQIRDLLDMSRFEPDWMLPSRMEDNPLIWMLSVDGFIMDIRQAPRGAQEAAFKAGLIPYIPADRGEGPADD